MLATFVASFAHLSEGTPVDTGLLRNHFLSQPWHAAQFPAAGGYGAAVAELARYQSALPGPVFVYIPISQLPEERWDHVIRRTIAMCACGSRRLLLPLRGRTRLKQSSPPRMVEVSSSQPLYLAPWAGDKASAFVKFVVKGNNLVGTAEPFAPPKTPLQGVVPLPLPKLPREKTNLSLDALAALIQRYGENACILPMGDVQVVIASAVNVDLEGRAVTMEVDAAAHILDVARLGPGHSCNSDAAM